MKIRSLLVALAATLLASAGAQAQGVVAMQLDSATALMRANGFAPAEQARTGDLRAGASTSLQMTLRSGVSYMLAGFCDQDCTDLDLVLYDASGTEVESDVEDDDVPIIAFRPSRAGNYRVEVRMVSCSIEPCGYGVRLFAQQ